MKLPWSSIKGLVMLLLPLILLFIGGFITEIEDKWERDGMEVKYQRRKRNDKNYNYSNR